MSEPEDDPVQKARELGITLRYLRVQEVEIRAQRMKIRKDWVNLHKTLHGTTLRDAGEAYWAEQRD